MNPPDMNGIPIHPGDVLRSFHYRRRQHGRIMYLYHTAVMRGDRMYAVPCARLDSSVQRDGGECLLTPSTSKECEIVQGYGPNPGDNFLDRPKTTIKKDTRP